MMVLGGGRVCAPEGRHPGRGSPGTVAANGGRRPGRAGCISPEDGSCNWAHLAVGCFLSVARATCVSPPCEANDQTSPSDLSSLVALRGARPYHARSIGGGPASRGRADGEAALGRADCGVVSSGLLTHMPEQRTGTLIRPGVLIGRSTPRRAWVTGAPPCIEAKEHAREHANLPIRSPAALGP